MNKKDVKNYLKSMFDRDGYLFLVLVTLFGFISSFLIENQFKTGAPIMPLLMEHVPSGSIHTMFYSIVALMYDGMDGYRNVISGHVFSRMTTYSLFCLIVGAISLAFGTKFKKRKILLSIILFLIICVLSSWLTLEVLLEPFF